MSGFTYEVNLAPDMSVDDARVALADRLHATVDGDAIRLPQVAIYLDPLPQNDEWDVAVDFYGRDDLVPALAAALPEVFPRVGAPMWS
jgi:hypothetical protein